VQYVMKVFEYENSRKFRIFDRDGEPWFVHVDVCRELDISNPSQAASRLDPDEKDTLINNEGIADSRAQSIVIINESGLYSLILTSRKPAAKKFRKWVTAEVLPSIRRTGGYGIANRIPSFIHRYNANWDRTDSGHFSIISELAIRLWGRLEQVGHRMADKAPSGRELRPDVSVGKLFSAWLQEHHPSVSDNFSWYTHWTPQGVFPARQYPISMLPLYIYRVRGYRVGSAPFRRVLPQP
jgi:prophage antirepressor-like protein